MADTKISALAALTGANSAADDLFPVVDMSVADASKNKSMTRNELIAAVIQGIAPMCPLWSDANAWLGPLGNAAAGSQVADRLYMQPVVVPSKRTFTTLAVSTTVTGTSSHLRLGLYNANPVTFHPTTLIFEGDNILDTSSGVGLKSTPFNSGTGVELFPGLYFLACVGDGTPATINRSGGTLGGWHLLTTALTANPAFYRAYTYAALQADETGNTFSTIASAGTGAPALFMR